MNYYLIRVAKKFITNYSDNSIVECSFNQHVIFHVVVKSDIQEKVLDNMNKLNKNSELNCYFCISENELVKLESIGVLLK